MNCRDIGSLSGVLPVSGDLIARRLSDADFADKDACVKFRKTVQSHGIARVSED
jgi:hypothetical protein